MRVAGGKKFSIGEWIVIFGLGVLAVGATQLLSIGHKWEDAMIYTVIVFTVVIMALRPAWGRKAFWRNLAPIFLLHVLAIIVMEQSLPPSSRGPHGLPLAAAGVAESVLIGSVLWKRSMKSNSHFS